MLVAWKIECAVWRLSARLFIYPLALFVMSGAEWFVIGGIIIAAADQILDRSPWKSNNVLQLLLEGLKTIFRVKG